VYANKKYHSGLICGGVFRGLAAVQLSGSPNKSGEISSRTNRKINKSKNPRESLIVK
jgi:hypothetical protein